MTHRSRVAIVLVVVLGLLTAGRRQDMVSAGAQGSSGAASTAVARAQGSATGAEGSAGGYRLASRVALSRSINTLAFEIDRFGHVYMSVAPTRQGSESGFGRLVEVDAHHAAHTFARTVFRGGDIGSIATTGQRWVVWTDTSGVQGPGSDELRWRIWAKRWRSAMKPRLLASSGSRTDRCLPLVPSGSAGVVWALPSAGGRREQLSDVWAWRPGRKPARVARRLDVGLLDLTLEGRRLIYLSAGADGRRDSVDCRALDVGTGRRSPLSRFGLAMSCVGSGNHVILTGHIPKNHQPVPSDGCLDDPFTLWQVTGAETPRQVEEGYIGAGPVIAGKHYFVWNSHGAHGMLYAPYGTIDTRHLHVPDDVLDYTGNGDWLALMTDTFTTNRPVEILLYRVGT